MAICSVFRGNIVVWLTGGGWGLGRFVSLVMFEQKGVGAAFGGVEMAIGRDGRMLRGLDARICNHRPYFLLLFSGQRSDEPVQRADILTGLSLPVFLVCVDVTICNCGFTETVFLNPPELPPFSLLPAASYPNQAFHPGFPLCLEEFLLIDLNPSFLFTLIPENGGP